MSQQARVRPSWGKLNRRKRLRRGRHNAKKFQKTAEDKLVGRLAKEICKEADKLIVDSFPSW